MIKELILDDCDLSDESFEQILHGVCAQTKIKSITYSNRNELGPKATK